MFYRPLNPKVLRSTALLAFLVLPMVGIVGCAEKPAVVRTTNQMTGGGPPVPGSQRFAPAGKSVVRKP